MKLKMKRSGWMTALLLIAGSSAMAQVKGVVSDASDGSPLPGATVHVKGTRTMAVADGNGHYQLPAAKSDTLTVSFLGFQTMEAPVGERNTIDVSLQENRQELNEIVVVGYGVQRRKELTGAIATISKAHLEYNVAPSVDALLSGAVAGVSVTQSSGQPGAPSSIRIRGGNSINADNDPLYVIDGFLVFSNASSRKAGFGAIEGESNPLDLLNPSDIQSIEVLKDVSATAIYGSRGSNGVILITTKKGKSNGATVGYGYSAGISRSAKKLDLLNATQWARLQKDYFLNKPGYSDEEIATLGEGYDWQDAVLQTGLTHNHSLTVSGGNEQTQYFISGNYLNQEGIILHSGFERFTGRVNLKSRLSDRLSVGVNLTANSSTQNSLTTFEGVTYNSSPFSKGIANSLTYALYIPPVVPFRNAAGSDYNYSNPFEYAYLREGGTTANPISDLVNSTAQTENAVFLGNVYAQYSPVEGLTAKLSVGNNTTHTTQKYFSPSYTALGLEPDGIGGKGHKQTKIMLSEFTLTYAKRLNDKHAFDVLAGATYENTKVDFDGMQTAGFTDESLGADNLQDGLPYGKRPVFSGVSESKLYSLLGRVNYSLLDRYHLTANFRSDYSTNFAASHKWGFFPSIGLSWNINEEAFFKNSLPTINNLKLRASVGSVGNQEIDTYLYLKTMEAGHYGGQTVYGIKNFGNDNLKWETTTQYNLGLDAGFLNNRFSATVDVYYKKTSDLLLEIPPALGQEHAQMVNVGNVVNKGVEFSVNGTLIDRRRLRWSLSANIARNINRITGLTGNGSDIYPNPSEILRVGEALGSFYGLEFDGVVQQGEDVSALPTTPAYTVPQAGDPKFKDHKADGHIDKNDRVILGSRQPDFTYGLSSTLHYRNFDFFVLFQGSQGNEVYNQLRRYLESPGDAYNVSAALLDAWTENNSSQTVPRITNVPLSSELDSRYIEDASYLRLKTLTLGYTLGRLPFVSSQTKLRLYVTAQNLFTLTAYKGYDPEIAKGTDLGAYPVARVFYAGLNLSF
ncbi:MAG: TonB-dependent receptor [Prevotellaceae bacterium]|jgi:TonB-linked SusC/RagA family outer membrane protein|nr:TonB-dependent receptor [Prevotellaceae bacterium]